jgi:hypothetical protein
MLIESILYHMLKRHSNKVDLQNLKAYIMLKKIKSRIKDPNLTLEAQIEVTQINNNRHHWCIYLKRKLKLKKRKLRDMRGS